MAGAALVGAPRTGVQVLTHFAPPDRLPAVELRGVAEEALLSPVTRVVLEAAAGLVMVLDEHRQVLAANDELLQALGLRTGDPLVGLRPGEVLHCVNALAGPGGCGTSAPCRHCGAVLAILGAQTRREVVSHECCLLMARDGQSSAREFRVRATPVRLGGREVVALVLTDVSEARRKEVLDRVFLNDMRHVVGGLLAWGAVLAGRDPSEEARAVVDLSRRLGEEVDHHRLLGQAERGDLVVQRRLTPVATVLSSIQQALADHPAARGRWLAVRSVPESELVDTDPALLRRAIVNLVINALEATPAGGRVDVRYRGEDGRPSFLVHNPGVMRADVAERVFQRSFSTKGAARGVGTWSTKLLVERYLGGVVTFVSMVDEGTVFVVRL
jgi:signal transduction histidine kinase